MTRPLVTIVTPTYNQAAYLNTCLESVLAQTYERWEQVVVDDGSTDETEQVVRQHPDPRIKYVRLPHRGLGLLHETYNTALAHSQGELVAILEGDDFWPPDKLALQVPTFDEADVLITWGCGSLVDHRGRPVRDHVAVTARGAVRCYETGKMFRHLVRENVLTPSVTVMVRRRPLEVLGGFRQTGAVHCVDLSTWLWITALWEGRVCFQDQVLGCWRQHPAQTTRLHRYDMLTNYAEIVAAVVAALPAEARTRVGWDHRLERLAEVGACLGRGQRFLAGARWSEAGIAFRSALRAAQAAGDRSRSLIGIWSSWVHYDLYSAFQWLAEALRGFRLTDKAG